MSKFLPVRLFFVWLLFGILLAGCGNSPSSDEEPPVYSPARVLTPEAPGKKTLGSSPLILDISNQDQGYLTAESDSDDSRMNIQLTAPSGVVYSYFLEPDEQTVLPFSEGSGEYLITCYQQVDGNQYAALYTETLTIKLQNEFLPFLYPNQYVDFSSKSEACKLAASLVKEDMTDIDILKTFYTYVTSHISYDYDKADSVEAGYLPDVDDTLSTGTGICFDYAAVMTFLMIAVILVLIAKVVPVFSKVYAELGSELTGTARTLLHISTILNHYMLGFIIAFLVLLIICMILYHTDLGRVLFLGQKLAMTVASGRVANCLYLVLSSGLDSNIGLTLARELVNNPHMQALIDKCHENIRHGESFDKGLLLSGIFSQMYASWIVIGSRTGEMESIVSQREINTDTASYLTALRAALRQINGIIYTSAAENMIAIDSSILQLYKDGRIDKHTAISEAVNPEIMSKRLNLL